MDSHYTIWQNLCKTFYKLHYSSTGKKPALNMEDFHALGMWKLKSAPHPTLTIQSWSWAFPVVLLRSCIRTCVFNLVPGGLTTGYARSATISCCFVPCHCNGVSSSGQLVHYNSCVGPCGNDHEERCWGGTIFSLMFYFILCCIVFVYMYRTCVADTVTMHVIHRRSIVKGKYFPVF
jgi:hypothetical protein